LSRREILAKVSEILNCKVNEESSMDTCDDWDSLNHISIVLMLKEDYGLEIGAEDIQNIRSVKDIIAYFEGS
jgi:acyl carrier protein